MAIADKRNFYQKIITPVSRQSLSTQGVKRHNLFERENLTVVITPSSRLARFESTTFPVEPVKSKRKILVNFDGAHNFWLVFILLSYYSSFKISQKRIGKINLTCYRT